MILLILIFNILMASTFTFSKAALWYLSPLVLIMTRFLASGTCLLGYLWCTNPSALYIPLQDWHLFFAVMVIPFYGSFVMDNWSLQFISSSKSCLIYNLMPLISAIIAYIGFKRKVTLFQWFILFFGFASLIPIFQHDPGSSFSEGVLTFSYIIERACLLFGMMIAIFMIWKKQLTRLQWIISIVGVALLLIIISNARYIFSYQTVSYIPEAALLISVALAAWGWLLIQHMLLEKKYSLLLVNGIGLFGAGLLSAFHLTIMWLLKTMPQYGPAIIIGQAVFYTSLWRSEQSISQKYSATLGSIVGFLTVLCVVFMYKYATNSLPIHINSELWQPNVHDQLFNWLSTIFPLTVSYWVSLTFYVGWLIVACHLIGYTLYSYLLKQYSATFLAFAGTTIPLIAAALGNLFLHEPMPEGFILSFVLMTGSLLLFYKEERKEG